MIVVIDTNVLLQLFGAKSSLRALKDALIQGRVELAVSTPVLLEYEEVVLRSSGAARWKDMVRAFEVMSLLHGNIHSIKPSYRFRTITGDPDDDAFADCAIAGNVDFIITNDHHFDAMIGQGYKPQPITPEDFIARHLAGT